MTKGEPVVWDGEKFISVDEYREIVKQEQPEKIGVLKKQELAKEILKQLRERVPRISGVEFSECSKKAKLAHGVSAGPSLEWLIKKGYMERMKVKHRRTFYMLTKKGIEIEAEDIEDDKEELEVEGEKILDVLEIEVEEK